MSFEKKFEVRWADLDPNFHMRHTSYSDYATHVRFSFLAENGFPLSKFQKLGFSSVLFSEKTDFLKEVPPGETITVNFKMAGVSTDLRKFRVCHEVLLSNGALAAKVTVLGAWFDTKKRSMTSPPEDLSDLLSLLPKTDDFTQEL